MFRPTIVHGAPDPFVHVVVDVGPVVAPLVPVAAVNVTDSPAHTRARGQFRPRVTSLSAQWRSARLSPTRKTPVSSDDTPREAFRRFVAAVPPIAPISGPRLQDHLAGERDPTGRHAVPVSIAACL